MPAVLGLDLGKKRIGLAVSDENEMIAMPLDTWVFQGRRHLAEKLQSLIAEYRIHKIVVGLPKTLAGEIGPSAQEVVGHVDWLKQTVPLEWVLWDERLTTQEIERVLLEADVSRARRKHVRDKLAAQRILQSYLESRRR